MRKGWVRGCLLLVLLVSTARAENILIMGDSISAGFGMETRQGWVSLLQQRLKAEARPQQVHNASISGETSSGGLSRLPALLAQHQPGLVVIELGGNDGLRGQPLAQLQQNLARMIEASKAEGAKVLLLGMRLPPNYGQRYTQAFEQVFEDLAQAHQVALVPFLLEGAAGVEGMMQGDGVHPTAAAQPRLLENAWPAIRGLLDKKVP